MKRLVVSSLLFTLPTLLIAGEATITGTGRVPATPDYVTVTVNVNAECYPTPSSATAAADQLASEIFAFMKENIDTSPESTDDVLSSGGYAQRFERYTSDENGRNKKVCVNTFQKANTITMKTKVNDFAKLFNAIQEKVYGAFVQAGTDAESPIIYATIGEPSTALFHTTRNSKERESRKMAVRNAISLFESMFVEQCEITSYSFTELSDPDYQARPMPYERASAAAAGDNGAPINFDSQWINTSVRVKFSFEGGHCSSK